MNDELEKKRITTYRTATETVRQLYGNLELGEALGLMVEKFKFVEPKRRIFIDIVGDIILGFNPKIELPKLLMNGVGLSEIDAKQVANELAHFLTQIGEPSVPTAVPDTKERLDLRPQGIETVVPEIPKAPTAPQQGARPLTREELMNALSPKRTMATDIEAVRQKQGTEKPKESFPGYDAFRKLDKDKK